METWQRGYDIAMLKALAAPFKDSFKPYSFGAFGLPKERDVATALADQEITWTKSPSGAIAGVAIFKQVEQSSEQTDFAQRKVQFKKGDLSIKHLAGGAQGMHKLLSALASKASSRPVWVEIHEERADARAVVASLGFKKVATKIAASSDIKSLYLLNDSPSLRVSSPLHKADIVALAGLVQHFASPSEIAQILSEIRSAQLSFEQHYSSYNKRQSWTALAIKGFDSQDPGFIIKPSEMSKGWKAENERRLRSKCEFTPLAAKLPTILKLLDRLPGQKERVRLMKLRQGNGELTRHADITDREAGTADGKICRLHVPLQTHSDCIFQSWNLEGQHIVKHFPAGCLFYLDIRKPHAVKNGSPVERIHLVVDVLANSEVRKLLSGV